MSCLKISLNLRRFELEKRKYYLNLSFQVHLKKKKISHFITVGFEL